ncbi:Calx-beta domain-containing protein, partial [Anabaena sp. UHCC 0451]|uniref:Calx-beta domain-containing protein n=1 Tax=Anabaena sp. UHCC 0451 TaxID=2055235 RepID=UPI002B20B3F1
RYVVGTANTATVNLADNDKPTITISATDANAAETVTGQAANPGRFTLTRTGNKSAPLTVNYTVVGTATNGVDYQSLTKSVTFAAGSATAIINVNVKDDAVYEGNETVIVNLASSANYSLGTAKTATVNLVDNDSATTIKPTVTISASDGNAGEILTGLTANPGRFKLTRTGDLSSSLTVNYSVAGTATNGVDYQSLSGTTTFSAGASTALINVNPVDDALVEGNETVIVTLASSANYVLGTAKSATVNIADNDPAPFITVTSPNGGESLVIGANNNLTWADNIAENVKIDLYKGGVYNRTIFSSILSDGSESWTLPSNLVAGADYQIKISSVNNAGLWDFSNSNFTFNLVPSDYAGNSLTQARNIGTLMNTQNFSDFVGDTDTNDYYRFSVSSPSNFNLSLSGLSGNADVQLIQDINGNSQVDAHEILGSSILTGSSIESINVSLFSGNYYVRIYPSGNGINTNYNISLSATSLGNYDYTDSSPTNNTYYDIPVTRSFFNSSGIGVYQSQYGTFLMYGSIADYYSNNQYANPDTTNGLSDVYSGLGLPTSPIYKQADGSSVMEFEGGKLTNLNGIVTATYNQKSSSFALVGKGAPNGTELQWKNDYSYWSKNVGTPTSEVRFVNGGWVQDFADSQGNIINIFSVKDGQQLTQGGPYRVQGAMLYFYRLVGGYERQNGGLGFATQVEEKYNFNGYKHYQSFDKGFLGITFDDRVIIQDWQGKTIYSEVSANNWKAEYFNNRDLTGSPTWIEDLGSGSQDFSRNWGNGAPTNTPVDNFSGRFTTTRYFAPGLYHITVNGDDGVQAWIGNERLIGQWNDFAGTYSGYFRSTGGYYAVKVEHKEISGGAGVGFKIEEHQAFIDSADSTTSWAGGIYHWYGQGTAPSFDVIRDQGNLIGYVNLGSNVRSDGKIGINANWGQGAPNGDNARLPHNFFGMTAWTLQYFDGSEYKFRVRGDDGFHLFANNVWGQGGVYNITPANQWVYAHSDYYEVKYTLPAGWYDVGYDMWEGDGDTYIDMSWEKVVVAPTGYYSELNTLSESQWDQQSGDDNQFRPDSPYGGGDQRGKTDDRIEQIYTDLSNTIFGTRYHMTSGYLYDQSYYNETGKWHAGIDIGAGYQTPIKAVIGGSVAWIHGSEDGYVFVGINSDDGRQWVYGHLKSTSGLSNGKRINAGDTVGLVGYYSGAPHLHLEVRTSNQGTGGANANQQFLRDVTMSPLQAYWQWKNR